MMYLVPNSGDPKILSELASRAGMITESPRTIRDLILFDREADNLLAFITSEQALILSRHLPQLLDDTPYVIQGAPGLIYTGEWQVPVTAFPSMDYMELEQRLRKSGHTSFDKEEMAARSGQEQYSLEAQAAAGDTDDELGV